MNPSAPPSPRSIIWKVTPSTPGAPPLALTRSHAQRIVSSWRTHLYRLWKRDFGSASAFLASLSVISARSGYFVRWRFAPISQVSFAVKCRLRSRSAPLSFETLLGQSPFAPRSLPASPLLRTPPTPAVGFPSAGLPSSCAELSERAMSLYPVPSGVPRNGFGASVLASAVMTRLATGCLSVGSIEAYIRDFTFVWLIRSSGWASARRSPFAQPAVLSTCHSLR